MNCMLDLSAIRVDPELQARESMSDDAISDYTDAYRAGTAMPPVIVYFDGTHRHLADGFHRMEAARQAGRASINADERSGSFRDAKLHAIGANATHGLRRTNADKRRAVLMMLTDAEWSKLSNREIARTVGVSHQLVNNIRKSLKRPADPATLIAPEPETRPAVWSTDDDESVTAYPDPVRRRQAMRASLGMFARRGGTSAMKLAGMLWVEHGERAIEALDAIRQVPMFGDPSWASVGMLHGYVAPAGIKWHRVREMLEDAINEPTREDR